MELTGSNESLYKGFLQALLCSVLIVLITFVLPEHAKVLFVNPTGNVQILAKVGPLLALVLLLRWRPSRKIAITVFTVLPLLMGLSVYYGYIAIWGFCVVLVLDLVLLYLLISLRELRMYLRER